MKNIYYWSPFIGNIATIKSVINSAHSLVKYSNSKFVPTIINSSGEWDSFALELNKKKINIHNFKNLFKIKTNVEGFIRSRFTYIMVFLSCFFLLRKTLKKKQPEFLIAHLITSLPIFLFFIFDFKTKLIIRLSGKVKMNFLRKLIWKLGQKKINLVTCPTKETYEHFMKLNLIQKSKIIYLPDPVIEINEIIKKKNMSEIIDFRENFFVMVGRYTKQKNHLLAIRCMSRILKKYLNIKLLIIGGGELKKKYINEIKKLNLENNIILINYSKNIPFYLNRSICFISTSLWEDPGFVMIEAAALNTFVISSDCSSGPKEFVGRNGGILFKNNNIDSLEESILKYLNMSKNKIYMCKVALKKRAINFTKFRHFKILSKHLV